jgi:TRAP-type transport system small permease protein
VFIGAAVAYPRGEHMAFTSLLGPLQKRPAVFKAMTILIRVLTITGCVLIALGAWQQVVVGLETKSVVIGYPVALLPLPAFLCCVAIAIFAFYELVVSKPLSLTDTAEVE